LPKYPPEIEGCQIQDARGDGFRRRGPWLQFKRRKPGACPLGIPLVLGGQGRRLQPRAHQLRREARLRRGEHDPGPGHRPARVEPSGVISFQLRYGPTSITVKDVRVREVR